MPKLIKAYEAGSNDFCWYQRDTLEPPVDVPAEEVHFDIEEAQRQVAAEREAVLAEARVLAEQRVREAYEEGLRRGEQAGREQFDATLSECAKALAAAGEAMRADQEAFLSSLEPQVVRLAHTIAEQVLRREIQDDEQLVLRTVRHTLEHLTDRKQLILRMHPDDIKAIKEHKVHLLEDFDGIEHIELLPDESLTRGGCVAESSTLHVDARLETQLERALNAITE